MLPFELIASFCIGAAFTEKNLAHILVTSSLSGKYQFEFDAIHLQQVISDYRITNFLLLILSV